MHRQFFPGELLTQAFGQIPVNFHDMQMTERLQQRPSQRAQPGADFNQKIILGRMDVLGIDMPVHGFRSPARCRHSDFGSQARAFARPVIEAAENQVYRKSGLTTCRAAGWAMSAHIPAS